MSETVAPPPPPAKPEPDRQARRHTHEGDEGPNRSPFERDRDAILYTSALRRLAGITQVIAPGEGEVVHNRLTHTLEVAQIALRLAQRLVSITDPDLLKQYGGLDPNVVEAAALAHDLGHPPFGHVAEDELNDLMVAAGVKDGFEGNAQSFRIVTKLTVRRHAKPSANTPEEWKAYDNNLGLNLTRATLNSILKYPWLQSTDAAGKPKERKWGVYSSEEEDWKHARADSPAKRRKSLEAEIMDWADDIAYSVHDTEDFYRVGLIPLEQLALLGDGRRANLANVKKFLDAAFRRRDDKKIKFRDGKVTNDELACHFIRVCEAMPFDTRYDGRREQRALLRSFTSELIGKYITGTKIRPNAPPGGPYLVIEAENEPEVDLEAEVEMLKELTWQFVIKGPSLAGQQYGYRQIVRKLFESYAAAVMEDKPTRWGILPLRNQEEMEVLYTRYKKGIPKEIRLRVACDAIAGMTDEQATLLHHRLMGLAAGSVFDPIVR